MAFNVQYGSIPALAAVGAAAGVGEYGKYAQGLQQAQQQLAQNQQRINLDVQRAIQAERMQGTDIGFRNTLSLRDVALSDRSRRENLLNSNQQLVTSNAFQNQRLAFGNAADNARLLFQTGNQNAQQNFGEANANARQQASLIAAQQQQAASIAASERMAGYQAAAQNYRMRLGAGLDAQSRYQQAVYQSALSRQSAQQNLTAQQELLGFNSYAERDAYNAAIQPSAAMQNFYQQRTQMEQSADYTQPDQMQLQKIGEERAMIRQQLASGQINPRIAQQYMTNLDRLEQGITPSIPRQTTEQQWQSSTFTTPEGSTVFRDKNGGWSTINPPTSNIDLEIFKVDQQRQQTYQTNMGKWNSSVQDRAFKLFDEFNNPDSSLYQAEARYRTFDAARAAAEQQMQATRPQQPQPTSQMKTAVMRGFSNPKTAPHARVLYEYSQRYGYDPSQWPRLETLPRDEAQRLSTALSAIRI